MSLPSCSCAAGICWSGGSGAFSAIEGNFPRALLSFSRLELCSNNTNNMPFAKGNPGGPGNKGAKHRKTKEKEQRAKEAVAAVVSPKKSHHKADFPRKGPGPKDILIDTMRGAYAAANARGLEAARLEMALEAMPMSPERDALSTRISALKGQAGMHLTHATDLAKDVIPYTDSKLVSKDTNFVGNITVKIKKY